MSATNPSLPFSGRSPIARHCSYQAARDAAVSRPQKTQRYFDWLIEVGTASDHDAQRHFQWPMSTVCSVRNGLVRQDKVRAVGIGKSPFGKRVTRWEAVR